MLITVEGMDGSGKTTMAHRLVDALHERGINAIYVREPGGTSYGERVRDLFLTEPDLCDDARMLALFSARLHQVKTVILPEIHSGNIVVCDRFNDSSFAYQVAGGEGSRYLFKQLENTLNQWVSPDFTLYLDVDYDTALRRVSARDTANTYDNHVLGSQGVFQSIREGFHQRLLTDPTRFRHIDATQSLKDVESFVLHYADTFKHHLTPLRVEPPARRGALRRFTDQFIKES